MRWLALLLALSFSLPPAYAGKELNLDLTTEEKVAACEMATVPVAVEDKLIRESFQEVLKQKSWIQKPVARIFAKKIQSRVRNLCTEPELCTPANVLKTTEAETQKVFGGIKSVSGYLVLAGMQASVYAIIYQITKSTGGSVVATIIANSILGRFTDHFQSPINFMIDPVVRKFSQKMVASSAPTEPKGIDQRLVGKAQLVKETYTDAERDGIGHIMGPQMDQGNKVQIIQGYFEGSRTPESLSVTEQEMVARMMGVQLFEQRRYHAALAPNDPEYNALFIPYLRPLAKWWNYAPVREKIWGTVHRLETEFARVQGDKAYDREAAQKYYAELTSEWFEKPLPKITPRTSLMD